MKKTVAILIILMMMIFVLAVPMVSMADSGAAVPVVDWQATAVDTALEIAKVLAVTIIGVFGAWLTAVIGKNEKFKTVNAAQKELIRMAQITVGEIKQTVSDKYKIDNKNGKLTPAQVEELRDLLLKKTKDKMSVAALNVLTAAAVDINGLIIGVGDDLIFKINSSEGQIIAPEAATSEGK